VGAQIGSDNRWQGYTHQQLYDMLHSGPGSGAAGAVADRWSGMAGALADIQQEITSGVANSGATWDGTAGDTARGALGPLGDWAQQAATAADVMRISTELQGDLLAKARADMPVPVPVPQQPGQIGQVVTAQIDYEVIELSSEVAAEQAHQVMAQYEAATIDNVSTLGDFGEPPTLVVDTTPITGPVVRGGVRSPDSVRSVTRTRGVGSSASPDEVPGSSGSGSGSGSGAARSGPARVSAPGGSATNRSVTPSESTPGAADSPHTVGATAGGTTPASPVRPVSADSVATPEVFVQEGGATSTSAVGAAIDSAVTPVIGSTTPSSAGPDRWSSNPSPGGDSLGPVPGPGGFAGAVVPAARRSHDQDEPDEVHESKYLIEADDIYGASQTYTPPVLGESPRRR
jgi:hypothetical protein